VDTRDVKFRLMSGFHRIVFDLSKGRLANRGAGMPVLKLTTVGRKSGARRTTMLTSPICDGDTVVLVASKGGDARDPAWFLNLRDHPDVEVTMHGRTRTMRARVASVEEKAALWPRVVAVHPGYAKYQQRTKREIPIVVLEP
jgi:deazaflavin-dependent oxidoreductase (nitroreductase family)